MPIASTVMVFKYSIIDFLVKILSIVEEVLMMDKKEPISKSYRLYGTKVPAELVQELVKDE